MNRRQFLRGTGIAVGLGVGIPIWGSTAVSMFTLLTLNSDKIYTGPVTQEDFKAKEKTIEPILEERLIENIPFKLLGVAHHHIFAKAHYNTLDELVKNSSVLVMEDHFRDYENASVLSGFQSYRATLHHLCKKYKKPMVFLDPISGLSTDVELLLGLTGAVLTTVNAPKIITKSSSKRNFLKYSALTLGGAYLFMSSFPTSFMLKAYAVPDYAEKEKYFIGHILDQRNVIIANRLTQLPGLLSKEDLKGGDYVLVQYGKDHIPAITYYLDHPNFRKFKTMLYSFNYNLIDSNDITRYEHNGKKWQGKILNA